MVLATAPGCFRGVGLPDDDQGSDADLDSRVDADAELDACLAPTAELCNGLDDDCDGEVDNGFTVTSDPAECGGPALEGVTQICGVSWDRAAVVRAARIVWGDPLPPSCCVAGTFGAELPELDLTLSIGVLLGLDGSDGRARYSNFPHAGASPGANVDRCAIEVDWGPGMTLRNGPGNDLAVYEVNTPEAFSVQVRTTAGWSPRRYRFASLYEELNDTNVTLFDLDEFGLAEGEWIDALRLENIFNANAVGGPDLVDEPVGQGAVIRPGESGYDSAYPMRIYPRGIEFADDTLDTDLIWIVGLQPIAPATCCVR